MWKCRVKIQIEGRGEGVKAILKKRKTAKNILGV